MSMRWSRKLPCLCQHSPAPTDFRTAIKAGSLSSTVSSSPRRNGRAEDSRVWRWWCGGDWMVEDGIVLVCEENSG
ncbi:hypothetical protein Hanom_Chr17g01539481 [Helianthus anomalus]